MARLLVNGDRFESVAPIGILKEDYVELLVSRAEALFPGFQAILYRRPHFYEQDEAVPDLALVHDSFSEWWVALIPGALDNLEDDILPAVSILKRATYNILDANELVESSGLDHSAIERLTLEEQPGVVVISRSPQVDWRDPIAREGGALMVVEIFQSPSRQQILRVNGEQPLGETVVIATCHSDPSHPRILLVEAPAELDADVMQIEFGGGICHWFKTTLDDRVCLFPEVDTPLPDIGDFQLVKARDGRLAFRPLIVEGTRDAAT